MPIYMSSAASVLPASQAGTEHGPTSKMDGGDFYMDTILNPKSSNAERKKSEQFLSKLLTSALEGTTKNTPEKLYAAFGVKKPGRGCTPYEHIAKEWVFKSDSRANHLHKFIHCLQNCEHNQLIVDDNHAEWLHLA